MNMRLGSLESRIAALLLPVAILVLSIGSVTWLLASQFRAVDNTIEDMGFQYGKYQQLSANRGRLESLLTQVRRLPPMDAYYLAEKIPALAAAELEQQLKRVVAARDGQIISTQVLAQTQEDGLESVVIQVRLRCGLPDLVRIMYSLETGRPSFFIDNLTVTARTANARKTRDSVMERELDVRFDLTGYLAGGSP